MPSDMKRKRAESRVVRPFSRPVIESATTATPPDQPPDNAAAHPSPRPLTPVQTATAREPASATTTLAPLEAVGPTATFFAQPLLRSLLFAYHRDIIEDRDRRAREQRARLRRERRARHERALAQPVGFDYVKEEKGPGRIRGPDPEDGSEEAAARQRAKDFFDRAERERETNRRLILEWEDEHDQNYGDLTPESLLEGPFDEDVFGDWD